MAALPLPTVPGSFLRHTRAHPCPICGKPDWCRSFDDGYVECMRVESNRPTRNQGYLHWGGPGDPPGGDWRGSRRRCAGPWS